MVTILVTLAQFERETTAERVRANVITRLISNGKINGAAEVLGLIRDPERAGHFIKDEKGLKSAITIMTLFLKLSSKAKVLAEAKRVGIKGKNGQELTSRMVDYVLENSKWRYRGLWYANKENKNLDQESLPENQKYQIVNLDHGPLIDEKFLDKVVKKFDEAKSKNKKCGLDGYVYQLSNILFDEDGNSFKGFSANGGAYRYYKNQKTKDTVRVDEIEPVVMTRLKECLADRSIINGLIKKGFKDRASYLPKIEKRISEIEMEFKELNQTEKELRNKLLTSDMKDSFLGWIEEQVEDMQKNKDEKKLEMSSLKDVREEMLNENSLEITNFLKTKFSPKLLEIEGSERRNLLEDMIERIVLRNDGMLEIQWVTDEKATKKDKKKAVTVEDNFLDWFENGGSEGTRTLGLLRDRQAL